MLPLPTEATVEKEMNKHSYGPMPPHVPLKTIINYSRKSLIHAS